MKSFVILLVFLGFIGTVYAVPFISPDYSYEIAKHVIIGRVLSIEFLEDPNSQYYDQKYSEMVGLALYEIEVEEYLKNPTNSTIKVLGRYIDQRQTIYYETFPYEISQRVLLYIEEAHDFTDHDLIIDPRNSRVISEDFSAKQMMTNIEKESAPLKQIKAGIQFNEIQCKDGLVLIQKHNGSPACVTPESAPKLIERGWSKYKVPFSKDYWDLPICDPNPEQDFGKCRSLIPPQSDRSQTGVHTSEPKIDHLSNLTLTVSNQSFEISPVDIAVKIDGIEVIDENFEVGSQHNFHEYEFQLEKGVHTIRVSSVQGNAQVEQEFELDEEKWGYLFYVNDEEHPPRFVLEISDKPFGFL